MKKWMVAIYFDYDTEGWFKSVTSRLTVQMINSPNEDSAKAVAYSNIKVNGVVRQSSIMMTAQEVVE